jgi:hypothetical protein
VGQEKRAANGPPRRNPARQLRAVGVTGVFIDAANARRDFDFLALDAHSLRAIVEKAAQRAAGLKPDQQHRRPSVPEPMLEMVADAAGITHAARRDDDVEA